MKEVKIYGASDDLLEIEGDILGADEYNVFSDEILLGYIYLCNFDTDLMLKIYVLYDGYWSFALSPQDEEKPFDIKIERSFGKDVSYSETVVLTVPDNTFCKFIKFA